MATNSKDLSSWLNKRVPVTVTHAGGTPHWFSFLRLCRIAGFLHKLRHGTHLPPRAPSLELVITKAEEKI